jgi:hypothetical protein
MPFLICKRLYFQVYPRPSFRLQQPENNILMWKSCHRLLLSRMAVFVIWKSGRGAEEKEVRGNSYT